MHRELQVIKWAQMLAPKVVSTVFYMVCGSLDRGESRRFLRPTRRHKFTVKEIMPICLKVCIFPPTVLFILHGRVPNREQLGG
mmetsp:Transcript_110569/g.313692  ORF Transcript_110569/g.313692 Transcript_110569/m.313692 type:complete len:83 (-) Transcript_110569:6-254(-)